MKNRLTFPSCWKPNVSWSPVQILNHLGVVLDVQNILLCSEHVTSLCVQRNRNLIIILRAVFYQERQNKHVKNSITIRNGNHGLRYLKMSKEKPIFDIESAGECLKHLPLSWFLPCGNVGTSNTDLIFLQQRLNMSMGLKKFFNVNWQPFHLHTLRGPGTGSLWLQRIIIWVFRNNWNWKRKKYLETDGQVRI